MNRIQVLIVAAAVATMAALAAPAEPAGPISQKEAFAYVCTQMRFDCTHIGLPVMHTDTSIGAVMVRGRLGGVLGEYSRVSKAVYIDPLVLNFPVVYNAVLVHEYVHYVDDHDGTPISDRCDTEEKAHKIQHIWEIANGYWKMAQADRDWRSWYGCPGGK